MLQISRWLIARKEYSGIISGLDAAGKTTFLYQLRLGETVKTIPTIGFNVENIKHKDATLTLWDVGGCDRNRLLLRHYVSPDKFFIFIHDCADTPRLDESLDEFRRNLKDMSDVGSRFMWVLFSKQDLLPLQKRDQIVEDLRRNFENEAAKFTACTVIFLDIPGFSATDTDLVNSVLPFMYKTLSSDGKIVPKPEAAKRNSHSNQGPQPSLSKDELIERIKLSLKDASSVVAFGESFEAGDLPAWDHFTHLRAGYFVLLDCFANKPNMLACADVFLSHLQRLRASNPERFRNTTHKTMTIFWLVQLHVASLRYQAQNYSEGLPSHEDFGRVLLHKPDLMNAGLWKEYYSKDILFTPEARENWVHPDIKPLPTFIKSVARVSTAHALQGENIFLSTALAAIQETLTTNGRRGEIIKNALNNLQSKIVQLRTQNDRILPYSETQAYFWIQFTHASLSPLVTGTTTEKAELDPSATDAMRLIKSLGLSEFKVMFKISGQEWREYYSPTVWVSVAARMEFKNPDLRALPDVIAAAE